MPGSITANLLEKRPLELALRAVLAFGIALWLSVAFGPMLLDALLPLYERAVHLLDDHYRIDFALTRLTGHDKIGGDLVVLGHATVERTFMVFGAETRVMLVPGESLTCSTAIGVLMQPATVMLGVLLGWPARGAREVLIRWSLGLMLLALWLLLGIPVWLWISFQDIPIRAYAPDAFSVMTAIGKFLLNGGGVMLGASLGAGAIAAAGSRAASWPRGTASAPWPWRRPGRGCEP